MLPPIPQTLTGALALPHLFSSPEHLFSAFQCLISPKDTKNREYVASAFTFTVIQLLKHRVSGTELAEGTCVCVISGFWENQSWVYAQIFSLPHCSVCHRMLASLYFIYCALKLGITQIKNYCFEVLISHSFRVSLLI